MGRLGLTKGPRRTQTGCCAAARGAASPGSAARPPAPYIRPRRRRQLRRRVPRGLPPPGLCFLTLKPLNSLHLKNFLKGERVESPNEVQALGMIALAPLGARDCLKPDTFSTDHGLEFPGRSLSLCSRNFAPAVALRPPFQLPGCAEWQKESFASFKRGARSLRLGRAFDEVAAALVSGAGLALLYRLPFLQASAERRAGGADRRVPFGLEAPSNAELFAILDAEA
jgi:hypothetical protein